MNLSGAMTLISELGATLGRGEEGGEVWEMWTCGRVVSVALPPNSPCRA